MIKSAELWYVQLLHNLPHFDLTFHHVDSTFNPLNIKYLQSILFWAVVPILFLLLMLLIYVIYCYVRTCGAQKKHEKTVCVTVSVCLIVLVASGAIGVGIYGNQDTTNNIKSLFKIFDTVFELLDKIQDQIRKLQDILNNILGDLLHIGDGGGSSGGLIPLPDLGSLVVKPVSALVKTIQETVMSLFDFLLKFDLSPLKLITDVYEFIRWLVMLIVYIVLACICIFAIIAIGSTSRILIMLFCVFALIGLVVTLILTGVHLAVTVTASDLCTSPTAFIIDMLPTPVEKQLITYLLECDPAAPNPVNVTLQVVVKLVKPVTDTLQTTLNLLGKLGLKKLLSPVTGVLNSIDDVIDMLVEIVELLHCKLISDLYQNILYVVCSLVLSGTVLMLMSCCVMGILLSVLILLGLRACSEPCCCCSLCCGKKSEPQPMEPIKATLLGEKKGYERGPSSSGVSSTQPINNPIVPTQPYLAQPIDRPMVPTQPYPIQSTNYPTIPYPVQPSN